MTEQTQEQEVDTKDLKIQALLETISGTAARYENQMADMRVEMTVLLQQKEERIQDLERQLREVQGNKTGSN